MLVLVSILIKYFSDAKLSINYSNIEILSFFITINFISYEISNLITILTSPWDEDQIGVKSGTKHVLYEKITNFT